MKLQAIDLTIIIFYLATMMSLGLRFHKKSGKNKERFLRDHYYNIKET